MENQLIKNEYKKIELCEENVTAYDFMTLFCAISSIKNNYSFSRNNLLSYIANCKETHKFKELLQSIQIKNNGVYNYSTVLEDAVFQLKQANVLYTISPEQDSSIYISSDISIQNIIKPRLQYLNEAVEFVNSFNKFERKRISDFYDKMIDEEKLVISSEQQKKLKKLTKI